MQLGTRKMGNGIMSEPLSARAGYQSHYPMSLMSGNKSRGHTRGSTNILDRKFSGFDNPATSPGLERAKHRFGQS
jgi:hypothetical protein